MKDKPYLGESDAPSIKWKRIPHTTTIKDINIEWVYQVCIDWLKDPDAKPELKEYAEFVEMWEMDPSVDHTAEFNAWNDHEQECQDEMYMQEQRVLHGIS